VGAEHDAAHCGDEQDDRGDLEREQMVGQEEAADPGRRAEGPVDMVAVRQPAALLDLLAGAVAGRWPAGR